MRLSDFAGLTPVHRSTHILVSRGFEQANNRPVIVKALAPDHLHHGPIARLHYEERILRDLNAVRARHVPRLLGLLEEPGMAGLVLEDIGAVALRELLSVTLPLLDVLHIGTCIAVALVDLHQANVIHKDINPNNVVLNQRTHELQLIDFDLASLLPRELQQVENLRALQGTTPYVSPEQTGRVNRALDFRSDFFSLGVMLYELLAGSPPFEAAELTETIYNIIAKPPAPLPAEVPAALANLVYKLLEKDPEQRYKSAAGLLADLRTCQAMLTDNGRIELFELGRNDRSERFNIPQRLYGRQAEVQALVDAYKEVAEQSKSGFVFVTGASGMGKSALVGAMQPAITQHNGLFAAGKYDLLRRHQPFSALSQAVDSLVRGIMMEPEAHVERWRLRFQAALGNIGQALVDLVPSVELLVGKQKALPTLGPQENENRLMLLMQNVVLGLSARQPLVLFLDDLQWADGGTLKWFERLAESAHLSSGLLIIGAYRDNEVDGQHPLRSTLNELRGRKCVLNELSLPPLSHGAAMEMVRDTTGAQEDAVQDLARLVLSKAGGTPFFIHEFLRSLWSRELLHFERDSGAWTWDLAALQASTVTENVAQLLTAQIAALSEATQHLLSLAACIGNEFTLQTLAAVSKQPHAVVVAALDRPLHYGMVVPLSGAYRYAADDSQAVSYRFAHDHILQAAYDAMGPTVAQMHHYALGCYWVVQPGAESRATDVVEHLNRALPLVQRPDERQRLAHFNALAGRNARLAAAYTLAQEYLELGLRLVDPHADPGLVTTLHLECAQALSMGGHVDAAEAHLLAAERDATTLVTRVEVAQLRTQLLATARRAEAAMQAGIAGLRALGLNLALRPSPFAVVAALVKFLWQIRRLDIQAWAASALPPDAEAAAAERMLRMTAEVSIVFINPLLYVLCLFVGATQVLRQNIATPDFIGGMSTIITRLNRYPAARRWMGASLTLNERYSHPLNQARVTFQYAIYVGHLDTLPTTLMTQLANNVQQALEIGETLIAAHAGTAEIFVQACLSVERCIHLIDHASPLAAASRELNAHTHEVLRVMCLCLRGETETLSLTAEYESYVQRVNRPDLLLQAMRGTFAFGNTLASWVHGAYDDAYAAADRAVRDGIFNVVTDHLLVMFCIYAALTCTCHPKRPRPSWLRSAKAKLRAAGAAGPVVYGGLPLLIDAEIAAGKGRFLEASRLYEKSTRLLSQSGYTAYLAASLECAGRFAARHGLESTAQAYLIRARDTYEEWGALRKVDLLQREFSTHFAVLGPSSRKRSWRKSSKASSRGHSEDLDLPAIIEVSQALSGEMVLDRLVQKILRALQQNAGATRTALLFKPEDALQVAGDTQGKGSPLPHDLLNFVVRTQQEVLVNDPAQLPPLKDPYLQKMQPKALVCAPILHQGRVRGVVYLENTVASNVFSNERLSLVKLLACQAAVAMENARLHTSLEEAVMHRTEQLRKTNDRLIQMERQSTEMQMAGGFAHEMRNALSGTTLTVRTIYTPEAHERDGSSLSEQWHAGCSALVTLNKHGAPASEVQGVLNQMTDHVQVLDTAMLTVYQGLDRALRITGQILDYAQVGSLILGDERVPVTTLVDRILSQFATSMHEGGIIAEVQVPQDLSLPMKESHAFTIVRNLVDNAIHALTHQAEEMPRKLALKAEEQGGGVVLSVSDTGAGIAPSAQTRMFEPFFTTKGAHGTGLGLGLCKKLSVAYGGDLTFVSTKDHGTTFALRVPRR